MPETINTLFAQKDSLTQIVIPLSAVAVSIIALFVSIWAMRTQQGHNKKSVRPVGHIQLWDSLQGLQVNIVNRGCGPMLIKEFIAEINGKKEKNIIYHLPKNILSGITHETHSEPKGYWLLPGGELVLLRIEGDDSNQKFIYVRDTIRSIICDINTNLTFSDVYDETHPVYEKSLEWFKRTL